MVQLRAHTYTHRQKHTHTHTDICHRLAFELRLYMPPSLSPGSCSFREFFWEHLWPSREDESSRAAARDFSIKVSVRFRPLSKSAQQQQRTLVQ